MVIDNVSYDPDDLDTTYDRYEDEPYRAVSSAAVVSLVFGIASILAFLDWMLLFFPLVGLVAGLMAGRKVRQYPEQFSGGGLARTGVLLSLAALVAAPVWLWYSMISEAPEGYLRISYAELQPDRGTRRRISPVRRRSWMASGSSSRVSCILDRSDRAFGVSSFAATTALAALEGLRRNPPTWSNVRLAGELKAEYATRVTRVGGIFHVDPSSSGSGLDARYHLEADFIR